MKKLLLFAYYFPPLGMGGTQRALGFANHLPSFGWLPTIITVKEIAYYAHDPDLLAQVKAARIERTGSLDPLRIAALLGRRQAAKPAAREVSGPRARWRKILNMFLLPDSKMLWAPFAACRARHLLASERYSAIMSTGPPHSCHLVAARLAKKFNLPWIADFRDSWANGDFQPNLTPIHRWLDSRLQARVLRAATHVLAVSEGLAGTLRAALPAAEDKVTVLTNGFSEADFAGRAPGDGCFKIVHVGTVGNFVDPAAAIRAFMDFVQEAEVPASRAKLQFVGKDIAGAVARAMQGAGLQQHVECTGYVPHASAVRYLRAADVLLFIVSERAPMSFLPGKTFEYLAAGRPILAVSPEIEALKILREGGQVVHLQPNDVDGLRRAMRAFFDRRDSIAGCAPPDLVVRKYARSELAKRVARILDACVLKD